VIVTGSVVVQAQRAGLAVSLVGVDGSVWDLVGGPVQAMSGVAGIGSPDPERWWRDSPAADGSFHLGYRIPRADVTLPVRIKASTADDWLRTQSAFMSAIDPSGACGLRITAPGGSARTLTMRLTGGLSPAYPIDPVYLRHAGYTLEFSADYPYWTASAVAYTWTGTAQIPVNITTGKPVANPGDVPAWPKWTMGGPWSQAWVGPDSASLVKLNAVTASQGVVAGNDARIVDADPRQTSTSAVRDLAGADKWADVTSRVFAPIPAGDSAVRILAVGHSSGTVFTLQFTPAYRQPW
jgi:hypothetical protein